MIYTVVLSVCEVRQPQMICLLSCFFLSINICKNAYVLLIIVIVAGINMVPLSNLVFPNIIITRQKL